MVKVYENLDAEKARNGFILNDIRFEIESSPGLPSGLRKCFYIPWMQPSEEVKGAHIIT